MDFTFCNTPPSVNHWREMRNVVGWAICDEKTFKRAIQNTLHFVCVYYCNNIIGMGRIVGDDCMCFYIQDVVVKESYRENGIGHQIVLNLLSYIKLHAYPNATIALMAHVNSEQLYKDFGFIMRPNESKGPGMYMPNQNYPYNLNLVETDKYIINL